MRPAINLCLLALAACRTPAPLPPPDFAPGAFPHDRLTNVLARHVDRRGYVDYAGLRADPAPLDGYTALLAAASPDSHPDLFPAEADRLAYWLNSYNALVIASVRDRPDLVSVNASKLILADFFYLTRHPVGAASLSLGAIENDIVRARFPEPRIHFALNCASAGCPRLPQEAFLPDRLEAQLAAATSEFVNDPAKVHVKEGAVWISQIFEWYAADFAAAGGPIPFINTHGGSVPADLPVRYIPYDWSLTAQPR